MLTAADRLDDKATGFESGADDYLTKPFALRELVLRRARARPPARQPARPRSSRSPASGSIASVARCSATAATSPLTRKQFAVLDVLMTAGGGVVSAEDLLERAWDENADPFTNAVRITISTLRKRLGEPWVIETVPGVGYRMST